MLTGAIHKNAGKSLRPGGPPLPGLRAADRRVYNADYERDLLEKVQALSDENDSLVEKLSDAVHQRDYLEYHLEEGKTLLAGCVTESTSTGDAPYHNDAPSDGDVSSDNEDVSSDEEDDFGALSYGTHEMDDLPMDKDALDISKTDINFADFADSK